MARNANVDPEELYKLIQALHLVHVKQKEPVRRTEGIFAKVLACISWVVDIFRRPVIKLDSNSQDRVTRATDMLFRASLGEQHFHQLLEDIEQGKSIRDTLPKDD